MNALCGFRMIFIKDPYDLRCVLAIARVDIQMREYISDVFRRGLRRLENFDRYFFPVFLHFHLLLEEPPI
jgi:hypothetical protein